MSSSLTIYTFPSGLFPLLYIYGRKQRVLKSLLMKVKEKSEKAGLKLNIRDHPLTSWQIEGEKVEAVTDFIFLGSKITADGDCSHEIKRHLLLRRKTMTNLGSIFKSRNITLPTKVHMVNAFSSSHVWM